MAIEKYSKPDRIDLCLDVALEVGLDTLWLNGRGRDFEFGDDPERVCEQIEIGRMLLGRLEPLIETFDLNFMTLTDANKYYTLEYELREFLEWLEKVEVERWGSSDNTRTLKGQLKGIAQSNLKVWQLLNTGGEGGHNE